MEDMNVTDQRDQPDEGGAFDRMVGRNLATMRAAAGFSQRTLAAHMAARGQQKFLQQTVLRVEAGRRPLKLAEAALAADLLGCSLAELVTPRSDRTAALRQRTEAREEQERLRAEQQALTARLTALAAELAQAEAAEREASARLAAIDQEETSTK
jgi:transcriptional regulator with XRE-family HTH domain